MSKIIKTTNTDIRVDTSSIMVIEIGDFSFEVDERYPWIDMYLIGGEYKEFVAQIDEEDMPVFSDYPEGYENLKRYCLNWFFKNVEIVKDIADKED